MPNIPRKWIYLIILAVIWGTSYILIKKGLQGLDPIQLGTLRILIATLFLLAVGWRELVKIPRDRWKWVAASGLVGSFFPVFLFAFAQTEIDSSVASVLNSLVPLFTLFMGRLAFGVAFQSRQLFGVLVGLVGAVALILYGAEVNTGQDYRYAGLVILATIGYAANANILKWRLSGVHPLGIAVGNFVSICGPALLVLPFSGVFEPSTLNGPYFLESLGYIALLCLIGTVFAKVMFNRLVQISSPVFSVSVTYLIPIVGILWGLLDGERFTPWQALAGATILLGVYLVNKKRHPA